MLCDFSLTFQAASKRELRLLAMEGVDDLRALQKARV